MSYIEIDNSFRLERTIKKIETKNSLPSGDKLVELSKLNFLTRVQLPPSPPALLMKKGFKPRPKIEYRPLMNNRIRAKEVRLIDETGKQLGVLGLSEAIEKAREKNLDLIQVTEKVEPPVCKIMNYGKYIYALKKKERSISHNKGGEMKGIRITFNISDHDLETRTKQSEKFLKSGDKIRLEMRLRGREKAHQDFAKEKIKKFLEILNNAIPIRIERDLKKESRGMTMIISKK